MFLARLAVKQVSVIVRQGLRCSNGPVCVCITHQATELHPMLVGGDCERHLCTYEGITWFTQTEAHTSDLRFLQNIGIASLLMQTTAARYVLGVFDFNYPYDQFGRALNCFEWTAHVQRSMPRWCLCLAAYWHSSTRVCAYVQEYVDLAAARRVRMLLLLLYYVFFSHPFCTLGTLVP